MTLFQQIRSDLKFLTTNEDSFEDSLSQSGWEPFSDNTVRFLIEFSRKLYRHPISREYPDLLSLAFWCSRKSLDKWASEHKGDSLRMGRGILFHVTPGNVPINFAYSLIAGLLSGNINIVKLPSEPFPQVDVILDVLNTTMDEDRFCFFRDRIFLLRYNPSQVVTDYFSSICDVRIIWGGDETISVVRNSMVPARSFDVTFSDRYSLCALDASAYLDDSDQERIARNFYNDTYLFDQNACTAPHLIVWIGSNEEIAKAKSTFWSKLEVYAFSRYELQKISAIDKLVAAYKYAAGHPGTILAPRQNNLIIRIELQQLSSDIVIQRANSGYFYEYGAKSLEEILPIVNRSFQTLAFFGIEIETIEHLVNSTRLKGIDRFVPVGHTLDFSLVWDGYDLVSILTRNITIQIVPISVPQSSVKPFSVPIIEF